MHRHCFFNRDGICYFLVSDPELCMGVCANFKSFDKDFKRSVNHKLRRGRIPVSRPVDKYHLDLAFGHEVKSNFNVQGALHDEED